MDGKGGTSEIFTSQNSKLLRDGLDMRVEQRRIRNDFQVSSLDD